MKKQEYILCAAYHFKNGKKYEEQPVNIKSGFVSCGFRHGHAAIIGYEIDKECKTIDGFLTSKNRFVNRRQASKIAFKSRQIQVNLGILISEDLY